VLPNTGNFSRTILYNKESVLLIACCIDNSVEYRYQLPHYHIAFQVTRFTLEALKEAMGINLTWHPH
jgi:hypothetical protein